MTPEIILFIILQIINVILSTIKSIVLSKGYKWGTIISNTIYFGVYTAVLKQLALVDNLFLLVIITMIANFFGTWVGFDLLERVRKADLWVIKTVVEIDKIKDYEKALNNARIRYISYQTTWDECTAIDIFSESRAESKSIKQILELFNVKYSVYVSSKTL